MKKAWTLSLLMGIFLTTFSQQELFVGKYRKFFLSSCIAKVTANEKYFKIEKSMDNITYVIIGSPTGEGFRISAMEVVTRRLIMSQDFYFNGARWDGFSYHSWFDMQGITLEKFMRDIFEIRC